MLTAVVFALVLLSVFVWTLSTSFKPRGDVLSYPPTILPKTFSLENYQLVLSGPYATWFLNSVIVSLGTVVIVLLVSIPAAYGATRYKFKGQTAILFAILFGMAVGQVPTVLPFYLLAAQTQTLNTHFLLILVFSAWMTPLATWLLRGYFASIPLELDEAGMLDGVNRVGTLMRIILPLTKPAIAAVAIITFVYSWNEFVLAAGLTSTDQARTLPVGLNYYRGFVGVEFGELTAGVTMSLVPVVLVFLLLQRRFVAGLSGGALGK